MERVILGPVGTPLEEFMRYYKEQRWSGYRGMNSEQLMKSNAYWELLERVNMRLRGEDPGRPFHWKGL